MKGNKNSMTRPPVFSLRMALAAAILVAGLAATARGQAPEPGYWERTQLPYTGLATYYAEGLMDYVRGYRLGLGQVDACAECVGAVALLRAGDIGRKVWLQAPGQAPAGPFLVVDCARREDYPRLLARGWAVDVSFELGRLWGMNAPLGGVTVLEDPADAMAAAARPASVLTPFFVPPGEVVITAPTATPAVPEPAPADAGGPTPWPTRLPAALGDVLPSVAAGPALPTFIWPPPLTPIITTPTPAPQPTANVPAPPTESVPAPPTAAPPVEVAVGRAGAGLLGEPTPVIAVLLLTPTRPPPPTRTPRPDLTPILPAVPAAAPTAAATPLPPSLLEQLWRALLEWMEPVAP